MKWGHAFEGIKRSRILRDVPVVKWNVLARLRERYCFVCLQKIHPDGGFKKRLLRYGPGVTSIV
jgi:hypothetical protein